MLPAIISLRPLCQRASQIRNVRPTVNVRKDSFQLIVDVRHFDKDDIRVKTRSDYVIIEGKQDHKLKDGFVMRQFVKKFKLPKGCTPTAMEAVISHDGILTITAKRSVCESQQLPCETNVPLQICGPNSTSEDSTKKDS